MTKGAVKPPRVDWKALVGGEEDYLRRMIEEVVEATLEVEMSATLGAEKSERTATRLGYHSGYYSRALITQVGTLELRVAQERAGRFSTELFERYQRAQKALVATLVEMYVAGVSNAQGQGGNRGAVRA